METMNLSDVQEFKDELSNINAYSQKIRLLIEYQRRHMLIAQEIAEKNGRADIGQLISYTHHVVLNSQLPVIGTIEQGISRAHLLAQRNKNE